MSAIRHRQSTPVATLLATLLLLLAGCGGARAPAPGAGDRLPVVATTNIIADVVANIGGTAIELTPLMPVGADPHSFTPTPQDLITLNNARLIFVNGLGLEESLASVLDTLDRVPTIVPVNDGVQTIDLAAGADHAAHTGIDPHTWFSVDAVEQWTHTIEQALSGADPTHAADYAANASAYRAQLADLRTELDALIARIPPEQRVLVTDHDSLGYLAAAYDFHVIGSVVTGLSTLASPAAGDLAALQDQIAAAGVPAIFVGTTVNPRLAEQVAQDTGIRVVSIYTGSLSDANGPAPTYLDFMRFDVTAIVEGLSGE